MVEEGAIFLLAEVGVGAERLHQALDRAELEFLAQGWVAEPGGLAVEIEEFGSLGLRQADVGIVEE